MALTPVEIRHIRLRKAFFGYQIRQTDELLANVVTSFEDVWRDRADVADRIEQLEAELVRYRELEQLLRTTLISAERASQQITDQTRRESETVLAEARAEAREIVRDAMAERERLNAEINRVRAQLGAVLATIGGDLLEQDPAPDEATIEAPTAHPDVPPTRHQPAPAPPAPQAWSETAPPRPAQELRPPTPRPQAGSGEQAGGRAMAGAGAVSGLRTPGSG
ncbi:MAG: DivIVA domain-containing protein [Gaiellaceae bacterium]